MKTTTLKEGLNIRRHSRIHQLPSKAAITLEPRNFEAFLVVLDTPAKPNAVLKHALKRHAAHVYPR